VEQHEWKSVLRPSSQGVAEQSACKRCGGLLELIASLPKRLDSQAYDIFRCGGCGFVDWITQDIS